MNVWECQHASCGRTCVGIGAAFGLVAIGWFVELFPDAPCRIFCPEHNPDGLKEAANIVDGVEGAIEDLLVQWRGELRRAQLPIPAQLKTWMRWD